MILAAGLFICAGTAQPTRPPGLPHTAARTNLTTLPARPLGSNVLARPRPGPVTNAPAVTKATGTRTGTTTATRIGTNTATRIGSTTTTNASASLKARFQQVQAHWAFYPALIAVGVGVIGLLVLRNILARKKPAPAAPASTISKALTKSYRSTRAVPVHACNVLETGGELRQVWQFDAHGGKYALSREHVITDGELLPQRMVGKDWRSLFRRKLNIALLPPEHVFLRVVQLPRSDFNETLSMVELQLEKLSPMPVAQIVWSIQILPHAEGNLQTVIVMIAARSSVEEFLGKLEEQGYQADRLELPLLDQLQTTAITDDGAWIYPEAVGGKNAALVAWWYGGVLQNLDLLTLPAQERATGVKEQLTQMAWAGEMEGWMSSPPEWHLVADAVVAAEWEPVLRQGLDQAVEVTTPLGARELAGLTARRSAQADPRANLLPPEFAEKYRQQFVDRLWMRGLLGVAGLYAMGVAIYMVALGVVSYKTSAVETQMKETGAVYTNALSLKARYEVLKDRQELKFAALNCWNVVARYLPEGVTLETLNFSQGKRLLLTGAAPAGSSTLLNDFESALRKHRVDGELLFDPGKGETLNWHAMGTSATWTLSLELKRTEVQ